MSQPFYKPGCYRGPLLHTRLKADAVRRAWWTGSLICNLSTGLVDGLPREFCASRLEPVEYKRNIGGIPAGSMPLVCQTLKFREPLSGGSVPKYAK
jgi:hypothetical protein